MNHDVNHKTLQSCLPQALPLLGTFLNASRVLPVVILDPAGLILYANQALAEFVQVKGSELNGTMFSRFLTTPDASTLSRLLVTPAASPGDELLLNLVGADQVPRTLCFRCSLFDNGLLLLAEPPLDDNRSLQEELLQLNNQLSTLSRENVRKGRQLSKALDELKSAQAMLVHQEKMASLGQMTAGIAHEINNPLAYVLGNEQTLKRDFDDLLAFINTLGDALPKLATLAPQIHSAIISTAGEVGLEYLAEAVPRKLEANIEGLERVKKIVLDLRNFSRLDEAEQKYCQLEEGITSTLLFLGPLLQESRVTVETDFARLPQILCSPGPLNQAISNILANAIQASPPGETVRIATCREGDWCLIKVSDQGGGIPAENLGKVFDPFFTTKPVGSGTGLGLSICHQIVAAHSGKIDIDSRVGSGTVVSIRIPFVARDESHHSQEGETYGA